MLWRRKALDSCIAHALNGPSSWQNQPHFLHRGVVVLACVSGMWQEPSTLASCFGKRNSCWSLDKHYSFLALKARLALLSICLLFPSNIAVSWWLLFNEQLTNKPKFLGSLHRSSHHCVSLHVGPKIRHYNCSLLIHAEPINIVAILGRGLAVRALSGERNYGLMLLKVRPIARPFNMTLDQRLLQCRLNQAAS
jgi:hypothetical protein